MSSEKDQELEKILTQLNSSIGGTKNGEQPGKKPVPKPENLLWPALKAVRRRMPMGITPPAGGGKNVRQKAPDCRR